MKKNILTILIILMCSFVLAPSIQAGVIEDAIIKLGTFNQGAGLPTGSGDVLPIITGITNIILGFLALLFIIMVIYGGFMYMTAGGVADKAKKGAGIIKDATIGVGIVVLAGIFVNYILVKLIEIIG